MGYGGNLIWTSAIKTLHESGTQPLAAVNLPGLSDLLAGRLYDASASLADDAIFRGNPRLMFFEARPKPKLFRLADRLFMRLLSFGSWRERYEMFVFRRSEKAAAQGGPRLLHIDMRIHSYGEPGPRRINWKPMPRAADAVLAHFHPGPASEDCEMYFTDGERTKTESLIVSEGLSDGFVVVEPDTNRDYFGELRAWPADRWAAFLASIRAEMPELKIVQIGVPTGAALPGVVDLRGKMDFRIACLLLRRSRLFVGTEGGLMHAANAIGANALILWGGVTLPEFAGYPNRQRTLCKYVACAPCGHLGWCDNGHICMRNISVAEVTEAAKQLLQRGLSA